MALRPDRSQFSSSGVCACARPRKVCVCVSVRSHFGVRRTPPRDDTPPPRFTLRHGAMLLHVSKAEDLQSAVVARILNGGSPTTTQVVARSSAPAAGARSGPAAQEVHVAGRARPRHAAPRRTSSRRRRRCLQMRPRRRPKHRASGPLVPLNHLNADAQDAAMFLRRLANLLDRPKPSVGPEIALRDATGRPLQARTSCLLPGFQRMSVDFSRWPAFAGLVLTPLSVCLRCGRLRPACRSLSSLARPWRLS